MGSGGPCAIPVVGDGTGELLVTGGDAELPPHDATTMVVAQSIEALTVRNRRVIRDTQTRYAGCSIFETRRPTAPSRRGFS